MGMRIVKVVEYSAHLGFGSHRKMDIFKSDF